MSSHFVIPSSEMSATGMMEHEARRSPGEAPEPKTKKGDKKEDAKERKAMRRKHRHKRKQKVRMAVRDYGLGDIEAR